MSAEANKAVFRRFVAEVVNGGNLAAVDELVASDFIEHNPIPGQDAGREGLRAIFSLLHGSFSEFRTTEEDLIAEGDRVVYRGTWSGTQTGEFAGISATGREVRVGEVHITRIVDGKLVEHWAFQDDIAMLGQLGQLEMAVT